MWTRKELKEKAKERFKINYWKCVLAALLLALICGGAGSVGSGVSNGFSSGLHNDHSSEDDYSYEDDQDYEDDDTGLEGLFSDEESSVLGSGIALFALSVVIIMIIVIVIVVILVIVLPLQIFIFNPLEVGTRRFFLRNLREEAGIREVCHSFDHSYKNTMKIMFFRELYTFLWTLLFIIPGIVKSYEYRMIPYILGENPDITMEEAFAQSRSMMYGNKWKTFVLDLSFLGWYILTGLTLGILGIFYVNPYVYQTEAALYQKLKEQQGIGQPKEI